MDYLFIKRVSWGFPEFFCFHAIILYVKCIPCWNVVEYLLYFSLAILLNAFLIKNISLKENVL
ncbi:MAG: hypothetical protein D3924_05105 [Candidatus Electrothrix sp. AR4]|nr:hypothetical protein [Candidatus Electrothrix sp. AR4]